MWSVANQMAQDLRQRHGDEAIDRAQDSLAEYQKSGSTTDVHLWELVIDALKQQQIAS